jgi:hypothetical protein
MASHPARIPGLHTPTQSFSEPSGEGAASGSLPQGISVTDKKKLKEEADLARSRLTDQKFNIRECPPPQEASCPPTELTNTRFTKGDYPDPLLPRDILLQKPLPHGHTPETEKHLVDFLAKLKADFARPSA